MLRSFLLPMTTAALALSASALHAQTPDSAAVTGACAHPFGLYDNMELVYQLQNAAGKTTGTVRNRVVRLASEQNKKQTITTTTVLLKSGLYDPRQKLLQHQDLTFRCRQDTSFTDGTAELNAESLRSFRDRRFAYAPVPLAWPNQPTVGTTLPSGGLTVQVSSTAVDIAKVYAIVQKRKVTGSASITTPAGTFACYKVEAERESGTAARADMVMRSVVRVVDYYSPSVGLVRSEVYDKKGKLEQVRVLAAINKAAGPEAGTPAAQPEARSKGKKS